MNQGTIQPAAPSQASQDTSWRAGQQGQINWKATVKLLLLLAIFYTVAQVTPSYIRDFELQDAMREEARFASLRHKNAEQVHDEIYQKACQLGIRLKHNDVMVQEVPGGFRIGVEYAVRVTVFHYSLTLRFHSTADADSI